MAAPSCTKSSIKVDVVYLRHPSRPLRLMLLRGGVEKTLRKYGYTEITKEEYWAEEKDERA